MIKMIRVDPYVKMYVIFISTALISSSAGHKKTHHLLVMRCTLDFGSTKCVLQLSCSVKFMYHVAALMSKKSCYCVLSDFLRKSHNLGDGTASAEKVILVGFSEATKSKKTQ